MRKFMYAAMNGVDQFLRGEMLVVCYGLPQAVFAKGFVLLIEGFGNAIGVKQQAVAGMQAQVFLLKLRCIQHAQHHPFGLQHFHSSRLSKQYGRVVSGRGVTKLAAGGIEYGAKGGNKHSLFGIFGEQAIDAA